MATLPIRIIDSDTSQLVESLSVCDANLGMSQPLIDLGKQRALDALMRHRLDNRGCTMSNGTLRFWGQRRGVAA